MYSKSTLVEVSKIVEASTVTLSKCFYSCLALCTATEIVQPRMDRTREELIQVYESYFSDRRRNNKGRFRRGGRRASNVAAEREEGSKDFLTRARISAALLMKMSCKVSQSTLPSHSNKVVGP